MKKCSKLFSNLTLYIVEGQKNGFNSIPEAMCWATVTVATVGYGYITPKTPLGRFIASLLMLLGYGIIAVPTGIITHEMSNVLKESKGTITCSGCNYHVPLDDDTLYCSSCGEKLKGK